MKSLALCNSKQANKEKQLAGARARDSRPGVLPGDLFDRAPDNFLAESQSVLSTNWACVSAGEIKRPQLPTEMSSPGPAVTHKSKAPGLRPGRLDTQPTSTQTQSAVCRATMIRLANVSPEKKKKRLLVTVKPNPIPFRRRGHYSDGSWRCWMLRESICTALKRSATAALRLVADSSYKRALDSPLDSLSFRNVLAVLFSPGSAAVKGPPVELWARSQRPSALVKGPSSSHSLDL